MPVATLHLLTLAKSTDAQSFLQQLKQSPNTRVIVASRPRHVIIHPNILDNNPLASNLWDLLVLLQITQPTEQDPIPSVLRHLITNEYIITTGVPSKLLSNYSSRDTQLKNDASSIPLTGSLDSILREGSNVASQNLEMSPELLKFMNELSETHQGPVTMLNLLQFHHPDGKNDYYRYGQAFVPVAGKRGGNAKLVGNVVQPASEKGDSRGSRGRSQQDWWNEFSIVHYPSIRHFCDMLAGEDYQSINERYRLSVSAVSALLAFLLCRGRKLCTDYLGPS